MSSKIGMLSINPLYNELPVMARVYLGRIVSCDGCDLIFKGCDLYELIRSRNMTKFSNKDLQDFSNDPANQKDILIDINNREFTFMPTSIDQDLSFPDEKTN